MGVSLFSLKRDFLAERRSSRDLEFVGFVEEEGGRDQRVRIVDRYA